MRLFNIVLFLLSLAVFFAMTTTVSTASVPIGNYLELFGGRLAATTDLTNSPSAFTFEIWINPTSVSGIQHIISIGSSNSDRFNFEVSINGGALSLAYYYGAYSYNGLVTGSLKANTWSHIAAVISATSSKLFINGIQISSMAGANQLLPIGNKIVVGDSYLDSGNNLFKGSIDELRISDTVRDVASLWNNGLYQNSLSIDQNTVVLWHFDEQRGNTEALDASDNGFSGSLIGGDSKIHFFGLPPTPTPFPLPQIRWERPALPTLSFPSRIKIPPIAAPPPELTPTSAVSSPDTGFRRFFRPVYPR